MIPPESNGQFVADMEKVLEVYKRPFNRDNPVICMDETSKQLIRETRIGIPMKKGQDARIDYEYFRHGVCNIFMASEPLAGKRFAEVTEFKTKKDWAKFIKELINRCYPRAKRITLVLDNYSTHCTGAFYETFTPNIAKRLVDMIEFIFTPKHGSWLNMAEIELNVMNKQCLNRHIDSREHLEIEIEAWQNHRNNKKDKINWQFTDKDARIKLKKLYPSI